MTYEALWKRLTPLYEAGEAKAIARWMLDVRFGLTLGENYAGAVGGNVKPLNDVGASEARLQV